MKKILSILIAAIMILTLVANVKAYMPPEKFKWLMEHKIVHGRGNGDLALESTITREEMAKIIAVAMEKLGPVNHKIMGRESFKDVSKRMWSYHFIELCAINGWINGAGDGKFYPKNNITVQEVLAIVERAVLNARDLEFPQGYIDFANERGLLEGVEGKVDAAATRHDAFLILLHAISPVESTRVGE